MRILAGDIGGTYTRLVYEQDDCTPVIRIEKHYASADYAGLSEVIEAFLLECELTRPFDAVCLAVAGPVIEGSVAFTNLPWRTSEAELALLLQADRVSLINDLAAVAYAIPHLQDDDLLTLQQGASNHTLPARQSANFSAAVIGVGTGLGAAHLISEYSDYRVLSSEAGHAAFAPVTPVQAQLLAWLHQHHQHVSIETVLSGSGIYTLYQFFRDEVGLRETSEIAQEMAQNDPAEIISRYAAIGDDALCVSVLDCFMEILASAMGNIVLHYYPLDEVYLAGGIAHKLQHLFFASRLSFSDHFASKGVMQQNLAALPIRLITAETPGLNGALLRAQQLCASSQSSPMIT